jgi:putative transposase
MREDNLLCLRRRKFVVTTNSGHGNRVYPNIAGDMRLTAINQLWVADITYIRLDTEFVYLAVILDAFSRRVIGWALDRTLEAGLVIAALREALKQRQPPAGLQTVSACNRLYHLGFPQSRRESCRHPIALRAGHRVG